MSQRLTSARQSRVIGLIGNTPVYSIYGGDGETPETKTEETKTGEEAATGGETPPEPVPETVSKSEYEALVTRMKESDRNRTKAEAELQKIKDAESSELDVTKRKLAEAEAARDKAEERARVAQIQAEILKVPNYSWHEPDSVLRLIDMDSITVNEDGNVVGVKEAVKALASKSPYLLAEQTKGKGKDDQKPKPSDQATGHQPAEGGKPSEAAGRREELINLYPSLR